MPKIGNLKALKVDNFRKKSKKVVEVLKETFALLSRPNAQVNKKIRAKKTSNEWQQDAKQAQS